MTPERMRKSLRFTAGAILCAVLHAALVRAQEPASTAQPVNVAQFGAVRLIGTSGADEQGDVSFLTPAGTRRLVALAPGGAIEIEWTQPRSIRAVELGFEPDVPPPSSVKIEWWRRVWPDNGTGGWMKLDDPFNGRWTTVRAEAVGETQSLRFRFMPLDADEAQGAKRLGIGHRHTYKLRVTCSAPIQVTKLATFSDAVWKHARLRFEWRRDQAGAGKRTGQFEARNGRVLNVKPRSACVVDVDLEYADAPDRLSPDRGHVIHRDGETRSFAVFVDDVMRDRAVFVRDIDVLVSDATQDVSLDKWSGPTGDRWPGGTVVEQVARAPEQSFERLSKAMPPKPPRYLFLGVPDLRQEIALLPRGEIQIRADSLRSLGSDAELRPWKWREITYDFGSGEHPVMGPKSTRNVTRHLIDGWLPVVCHVWQTGAVRYEQTSVAVPLLGDIASMRSRDGTETVVLATRFDLANTSSEKQAAWLWIELSRPQPCRLSVDNVLVLDSPSDGRNRPGLVPVRGRFDPGDKGALDIAVLAPGAAGSYRSGLEESSTAREAVRYRVELAAGERHAIDLFVPYIELLDRTELGALKNLSYTNALESALRFWRSRVARGMTYEVPDRCLNEFFKANLWHVLISTDIDPITGQSQHGAATHSYNNFLNETAMVARSLEMRGEHQAAARLIEPFLASQGIKGLPGNFRSRTGVLYAAHPEEPDPYTAQGYNMHHGFGMWVAAEHFLWTRDLEYIARVGPNLVAAADWVVRERQATRVMPASGRRPIEFGLAPAGDLEDVEEYLYYYATDAYYHLGMKRVVQALDEAARVVDASPASTRPPSRWVREVRQAAARLAVETESFHHDIRASVAESTATSPVVRLRDGTYVPYVPSRVHALTHLKEGWIREALYPALHLVTGEVYDPQHRFVDWMIQDLEDNIFLGPESGYGLENPAEDFFDLGGFTLQPNLLDLAPVYLERDQVANFIRAFYNTAWASLYPDAICFAEWLPALGRGEGPLYKTPDECKFVQWMRQMLVFERDNALELGLGVPLAWMRDGRRIKIERAATLFGRLDLEIVSEIASNRVVANVRLLTDNAPKRLRLRLRDPAGRPVRNATVNGRSAHIDAQRQLVELQPRAGPWHVVATF